jgi:hypothetical protein
MKLLKTVQEFVSGSDKFFEIYECTVDEVRIGKDYKDRRAIEIRVGEKEFTGLWNKKVHDFLVANTGKKSFIVLWKGKKPLLAYAWSLWEGQIKGTLTALAPLDAPKPAMTSGEAFVYMWIDKRDDRKYIGKHKGSPGDGYCGSGQDFIVAHADRPDDFERTILAYGTEREMHELETMLILQLGAAVSPMYYNMSNNLRK